MLTSPITIDPSSIFSLAAAIKAGITTPELLESALLEGELVEGALVIDPLYYATDCGGGVGDGFETAEQAANDFASTFDTPEETEWIEITTFREGADSDGNVVRVDVEYLTRTLEPDEPECTEGEHDWQSPYEILGGCKENPGVWGHGGGVISSEVCMKCGCERVTDTWRRTPTTGSRAFGQRPTSPASIPIKSPRAKRENEVLLFHQSHRLTDPAGRG